MKKLDSSKDSLHYCSDCGSKFTDMFPPNYCTLCDSLICLDCATDNLSCKKCEDLQKRYEEIERHEFDSYRHKMENVLEEFRKEAKRRKNGKG